MLQQGRFRRGLRHKLVSFTSDGLDVRSPNLASQPGDVNLQGASVPHVACLPDFMHEKPAAQDQTRVLHKDRQQPCLFGREVHRLATSVLDPPGLQVEAQVVYGEYFLPACHGCTVPLAIKE